MADQTIGGSLLQQALLDVCNADEEVRGDGVALPESTTALKPATRDAVQEDGCLACAKGAGNPVAPQVTEATSTHDTIEAVPRDRVKSLFEIKFEDGGRLVSLFAMATT